MHREGAWTPGVDEESLRRLRPTGWPRVAGAGLGLGVLAAVGAGLGTFLSAPLPMAAVALLAGGLGLRARQSDDGRWEERGRVLALREEFGLGPVWMVDLMVRQGTAPTGRDQGLMWVEGGQMVYSGLRTSFALAPAQAAGEVRFGPLPVGLGLCLTLPLARTTPAGPLSLSFWPISDGARRQDDDAAGLRYALNSVLDNARWSKGPGLEGQWPPVEIGPGAPAPKELRRTIYGRLALGGAVAALFALCAVDRGLIDRLILFLLLASGIAVALRPSNARRWRAYRDAQRVWGEA